MSSCEIIDAFPAFLSFCRTVRVEPMVVSPPHRFHGIGRALLRRAIEEAKRLDVRYLTARPVAPNHGLSSFYFNTGLRTLGKIELFMELPTSAPGRRKSGIKLWGCAFDY